MAVCSRRHLVAHELHSVLDVLFANDIVTGAGLSPRTESAVRAVGEHHVHVLLQSRTRVQPIQVFQLIEKSIVL